MGASGEGEGVLEGWTDVGVLGGEWVRRFEGVGLMS